MSILSSTSASALSNLINTSAAAPVAVNGLISGLDTTKVIEALLGIEQQKIDNIGKRQAVIQAKQTAFKSVEAKLLVLQTQIGQLARAQNAVFDARTVSVSDADFVAAAASSSAVAGDYHLRINSLAKASQTASQGFDRLDSAVTQGTLALKVGAATTNITVDGTNNTLQGLANAINTSGAAVSATIVNDGAGDDKQGYRLILTSKTTGVANSVVITNNLGATGGGATKPLFNAGSIGNAILAAGNSSTSAIQSNPGTGFTGSANNVYTFTVVQGGAVGTDDGLQISFSDTAGVNTGTITLNQADAGVFKSAAQGISVQFAAGTLVAGDSFTVKAFVPTVQAATDASITLGSGAGALNVTSSSNQVDSLIPGVALSLKSSDPAKDIMLTVANDTAAITSSIQGFVNAYNDVVGFIKQQTSYNSTTRQAAPLLGNMQVVDIENKLRAAVANVVAGANPQLNHIGALGISTNDNGQLVINSTKLNDVLTGKKASVTLSDVRKLFTLTGSSTNPGIQFVAGTNKTKASSTPYTVQVTQAAEKATLTATSALAASTVIDNTNDTFVVAVDGTTSGTLTLAAGTYARQALADAVQAAINNDATLAARDVTVALSGTSLTITSNIYGSSSRVAMQSGNALATLGFTAGATDQGLDVAGSYVVSSVTETASGTGQFLTGNVANQNTSGLQVQVSLTPAQVGGGASASLTVTRGFASQLQVVLDALFDSTNGRLKAIDDGFNSALDQLDINKARITEFMLTRQKQMQDQFNAMERTLAQLQSAGNLLAQQAASLNQKK